MADDQQEQREYTSFELDKIEDEFRLWAFNVYYTYSFKSEQDNTLRFAKALISSSKRTYNKEKMIYWWENRKKYKVGHGRKIPMNYKQKDDNA